jgi:hypothetical protein
MKNILNIVAIIVAGALVNLIAPWYFVALIAFASSMIFSEKALFAFLTGFAGVFLLWLFTAIAATWGNEGILVGRMSELIGMSGMVLYLLTALIGGLTGGFASLSGFFLKDLFNQKDKSIYYGTK